jgi:ribose transport system ATP-binding protein
LIFGADCADSGSVLLDSRAAGEKVRFRHPRQAVAAGLAMVTEDRKQNGLLLTQSIRSNSTLNSLGKRFSRWGLVHGAQENRVVDEMISALEIKCQSREQPVTTLSGGNQQKVAVARWLIRDADIFFFDEPTRGIDIAARRRIYRLFDSLAQAGKGLVIVSSDLEELLETCDHIGVMSAGEWTGLFERSSWSREQIMQAAFSGYQGTKVAIDG